MNRVELRFVKLHALVSISKKESVVILMDWGISSTFDYIIYWLICVSVKWNCIFCMACFWGYLRKRRNVRSKQTVPYLSFDHLHSFHLLFLIRWLECLFQSEINPCEKIVNWSYKIKSIYHTTRIFEQTPNISNFLYQQLKYYSTKGY